MTLTETTDIPSGIDAEIDTVSRFIDLASLPGNTPLTPKQAAHFTSLKTSTLEQWRSRGEGPPFFRRGRIVRYKLSDLREWLFEFRGGV